MYFFLLVVACATHAHAALPVTFYNTPDGFTGGPPPAGTDIDCQCAVQVYLGGDPAGEVVLTAKGRTDDGIIGQSTSRPSYNRNDWLEMVQEAGLMYATECKPVTTPCETCTLHRLDSTNSRNLGGIIAGTVVITVAFTILGQKLIDSSKPSGTARQQML